MKHSERLQQLIDYARVTENTYLKNQLETLDLEIKVSIVDARLDLLKEVKEGKDEPVQ